MMRVVAWATVTVQGSARNSVRFQCCLFRVRMASVMTLMRLGLAVVTQSANRAGIVDP